MRQATLFGSTPTGDVGYDPRVMRRSFVLSALLLSGCAVPHAIESLGNACPPPELGRPAWVRTSAGTGAWIGGVLGGVVSIAILPVTYPISWLAEDGLGPNGQTDFLFFPALSGAAIGHALLGGATDVVDYTFRRAWIDGPDTTTSYDYVPDVGPGLPKPGLPKPGLPKSGLPKSEAPKPESEAPESETTKPKSETPKK